MEKILNLTPHAVRVVNNEGTLVREFPSSGSTIRLQQTTVEVGNADGVRLTHSQYGAPVLVTPDGDQPLPEQKEGRFYIVSAMVKSALPEREDMLVPAEQVRNDQGQIIGCKSLGI